MNNNFFLIIPANSIDANQILWLFTNITFFPNSTSNPPLPTTYNSSFDYRQFFRYCGQDNNGNFIVKTRQDSTVSSFGTSIIPTGDWTTKYNLSIAPTIQALPNFTEIVNGHNTRTTLDVFLSYDYSKTNLQTNKINNGL